jgi:hypothetical protein
MRRARTFQHQVAYDATGLSPATVDDHEGDTVGEHEFVNMLSPWWSL